MFESQKPPISTVQIFRASSTITLISGFALYFFERTEKQRSDMELSFLPAILCALVIGASFGAYYSAYLRTVSLEREQKEKAAFDAEKLQQSEIGIKLNRAKICRQMFSNDVEMKAACVELLKPSK